MKNIATPMPPIIISDDENKKKMTTDTNDTNSCCSSKTATGITSVPAMTLSFFITFISRIISILALKAKGDATTTKLSYCCDALDYTEDVIYPLNTHVHQIPAEFLHHQPNHYTVPLMFQEIMWGLNPLALASYYCNVFYLSHCSNEDVVLLKQSLARALAAVPYLAGRIDSKQQTVKLPLDTFVNENNKQTSRKKDRYGVAFRVIQVRDDNLCPSSEELSPTDTVKYGIYYTQQEVVINGTAPVFSVCIHQFPKTGVATLAISVCHSLMDGASFSKFVNLWAQECQAVIKQQSPSSTATSLLPVSRSFYPPAFNMEKERDEYCQTQLEMFGKIVDRGHPYGKLRTRAFQLRQRIMLSFFGEFVFRYWDSEYYQMKNHFQHNRPAVTISKKSLKNLKQQATPSNGWITTQEAIAAKLVQTIFRSKAHTFEKVRVYYWYDGHKFLNVPSDWLSGICVWPFPCATVYNDGDQKSLSDIAKEIHDGLQKYDSATACRHFRILETFKQRRFSFVEPFAKEYFKHNDWNDKVATIMINNHSKMTLPNFFGDDRVRSVTNNSGPTLLLPMQNGNVRMYMQADLGHLLTESILQKAFSVE